MQYLNQYQTGVDVKSQSEAIGNNQSINSACDQHYPFLQIEEFCKMVFHIFLEDFEILQSLCILQKCIVHKRLFIFVYKCIIFHMSLTKCKGGLSLLRQTDLYSSIHNTLLSSNNTIYLVRGWHLSEILTVYADL